MAKKRATKRAASRPAKKRAKKAAPRPVKKAAPPKKRAKKAAPGPAEKIAKETHEPWVVARLADVARFFGRSLATVKGDWRPGGMPGRAGAWDLKAILQWRDGAAQAATPAAAGDQSKADAERRKAIAEAAIAERKERLLAGKLIELEPVRRLFVRHVEEAKALMGQIPDRVAAALPAKTAAKIRKSAREEARRVIDDVCESLADLLNAPEALPDRWDDSIDFSCPCGYPLTALVHDDALFFSRRIRPGDAIEIVATCPNCDRSLDDWGRMGAEEFKSAVWRDP